MTVRNEVAKVMFLQAFVCPHSAGVSASVHDGIPHPRSRHTPWNRHPLGSRHPCPPRSRHPHGADSPLGADIPPKQTHPQSRPPGSRHPLRADTPSPEQTPPRRDGHCCGRYASYWNAFLYISLFLQTETAEPEDN